MTDTTVRRGEDFTFGIEAVGAADGDLTGYAIDVGLKKASFGNKAPASSVARVATFTPSPRPAAGGIGPGWNLSLTATQTLALAAGTYITDAALTLPGGAIDITEPVLIRVVQGVSR